LYNLGGGKDNSASLREIIDIIARQIELEPKIVNDDLLPHPVPVNYVSDLSRIRGELGWQPQVGIEEGLQSLL
jgi:nucleoside-diphosphate-sugar epimerase